MSDEQRNTQDSTYHQAVSRRRFLRTAAWSGAALGVVGLGGLGFAARASEESNAPEANAPEANAPQTTASEETETEENTESQEAPDEKKLGEYRTDYRYSDSKARKYNLRISSRAVDGTVVKPGETFSMNEHLIGLDYKSAKVFSEGGETTADGGGLCQVTSTVYMAAHYAGMEMVERHPHYTVLSYIRPGFDATVWFGYNGTEELDMKFKNSSDSDVRVREYVTDDGFLVAEIWGQPNGKKVEMRSEQDFKDTSRGIQWSTYKKVTQEGEILRQGLLHTDLYSFPPPESVGDEGYNDVRTGGW